MNIGKTEKVNLGRGDLRNHLDQYSVDLNFSEPIFLASLDFGLDLNLFLRLYLDLNQLFVSLDVDLFFCQVKIRRLLNFFLLVFRAIQEVTLDFFRNK